MLWADWNKNQLSMYIHCFIYILTYILQFKHKDETHILSVATHDTLSLWATRLPSVQADGIEKLTTEQEEN